ncbi:glycosyltransferase [Marivivens sp. JLT3646]|uniref:glycosyltransferase n=1 Tax=Marivivens sp. JLT3646 TaxID=1920883 RepID=UPI0009383252|nr:glycosyltransferase [Marivivens sp. JLT3646]APO85769.1 hypothetical protein BSK21_01170 [Marivivens sp. JLT3646]
MTLLNIQMLGLCRFSYPSEVGAFRHNAQTMDELRAELYGPSRMATRFFFFEQIVLPALKVQTDPNFRMVLLAGERMPDEYKERLTALCSSVPQIEIVFAEEGRVHREICREVMVRHRDPSADIVAEFRIDDDDAVATDFIETGRSVVGASYGLADQHGMLCVDFAHGILLGFDRNGVRAQNVKERMWTPAQIFCRRPDDKRSILDMNHIKAWAHMPTVSMASRLMFVRGAHFGNDSDLLKRPRFAKDWGPLNGQIADRLASRFGLDVDVLTNGWKALGHRSA